MARFSRLVNPAKAAVEGKDVIAQPINIISVSPVKHANTSEGSDSIAQPSKYNRFRDLRPSKDLNSGDSAVLHHPKVNDRNVGGNLISPVIKFGHFRVESEQKKSSCRHERLAHCWMDNSSRAVRE
jgi:hypothetical protein